MDAVEALRVGFVNRVVPRAQLLPAASGLAREIMAHDARVVRTIKEAVNRGLDLSLGEGLELEARVARGARPA